MGKEKGIVLVTGSSGLIGTAVMRQLVGRFEEVVGFDFKEPKAPLPGTRFIAVDLTKDDGVRKGLRNVRELGATIASVIHLAAYYDFSGKPSEKYEEITVRGTERLLRGVQELDFEVQQFVFSSTMLVHKPAEPGQLITEEWPLEPTWAYPESKVRTEQLIRAEHNDIPIVLLRIAGVYDDFCRSIPLAHQIQRIYERQLAGRMYAGEVAHGQAFIHLDDLVAAIARVVEHRFRLPLELALLLGEPETLTYDELQHSIARLLFGESWETHEIPGPIAKAGAWVQDHLPGGQESFIKPWMIDRANDHYALDIGRARELLDWQPRHSLRATLPKMIATLKRNPQEWYGQNKLTPPPQPEQ